ncbi:hypothetical protein BSLA_02r1240 [Burkholderia stabilis]|nr:hypothetical protein BSLA_02r1240 [Burkholderia stabilis]
MESLPRFGGGNALKKSGGNARASKAGIAGSMQRRAHACAAVPTAS